MVKEEHVELLQQGRKPFLLLEKGALIGLLLLIVALPILDILARELPFFEFNSSSLFLKYTIVWFTMFAGQLASQKGEHLSLAVFEHLLPSPIKKWTQPFVALVVATTILSIAYASLGYIKLISEGHPPIGFIPMWLALIIIPIGFTVMGVRSITTSPLPLSQKTYVLIAAFLTPIVLELLPDTMAYHLLVPSILALSVATLLGAPIFTVLSGFAAIFIFHEELSIFGTSDLPHLFTWLIGVNSTDPITSQGLSSIPHMAYEVLTEDAFPTIPLFTFVGFLLSESKAGERLVAFFQALLGGVPGGIALMAVIVSAFFTTFTGASGVTILALGGLLYFVMKRDGYSDQFTVGYLTASGSIGLLFPPSLPIILYAAKAGIDPKLLFAGGVFPGILLVMSLGIYALFSRKEKKQVLHKSSLSEILHTFKDAWGEILLPIIILVAYFGGFATIVQSASIAVVYLLFMHLLIHKDILLKQLPSIALKAAPIAGSILIIMAAANSLQDYIVMAEIPTNLTHWFTTHFDPSNPANKWIFLLILNITLLITGFFMDIFSAIIVVIPLIQPISMAFGIDPIHLGIIFLANLELGYLTPPVGLNLFLAALRFDKPLLKVYQAVIPFLLILGVVVLLVTYIPAISLSGVSLFEKLTNTSSSEHSPSYQATTEEAITPQPELPQDFFNALNGTPEENSDTSTPSQASDSITPLPQLPDNFMDQINGK